MNMKTCHGKRKSRQNRYSDGLHYSVIEVSELSVQLTAVDKVAQVIAVILDGVPHEIAIHTFDSQ